MAKQKGSFTGADKNMSARQQKLLARFEGEEKAKSDLADWTRIDPDLIHRLIFVITQMFGAVMFSSDKSGGGFLISVYLGGDKKSQFFKASEEGIESMYEWMNIWIEGFEEDSD